MRIFFQLFFIPAVSLSLLSCDFIRSWSWRPPSSSPGLAPPGSAPPRSAPPPVAQSPAGPPPAGAPASEDPAAERSGETGPQTDQAEADSPQTNKTETSLRSNMQKESPAPPRPGAPAAPAAPKSVLEAGREFLKQNREKSGVKIRPSGLQYKVLKEGKGGRPGPQSMVTVHYRGTLIDGSEFDSSYSRGQPASFPLNRVIRGWTEGLQLMRPGAVYQFFIPSELGYGARAAGKIPAHSTLIFKVELISVQ